MNFNFFWALTAANQWHTNRILEENNSLLEEMRRQMLSPKERAAEDKAEAEAEKLRIRTAACAVVAGLPFLIAWAASLIFH
jgi:hypothetical protein